MGPELKPPLPKTHTNKHTHTHTHTHTLSHLLFWEAEDIAAFCWLVTAFHFKKQCLPRIARSPSAKCFIVLNHCSYFYIPAVKVSKVSCFGTKGSWWLIGIMHCCIQYIISAGPPVLHVGHKAKIRNTTHSGVSAISPTISFHFPLTPGIL